MEDLILVELGLGVCLFDVLLCSVVRLISVIHLETGSSDSGNDYTALCHAAC